MDEKERQELKLEEIMREFSDAPAKVPEESEPEQAPQSEVSADIPQTAVLPEEQSAEPEPKPAEPEPKPAEPEPEERPEDPEEQTMPREEVRVYETGKSRRHKKRHSQKTPRRENPESEAAPEEKPEPPVEMQPEEEQPAQMQPELSQEAPEQPSPVTDDTVRLDTPVRVPTKATGDTIRLDGLMNGKLPKGKVHGTNSGVSGETQVLDLPPRAEPFSEQWEPEYEQPIGEYVPPQPIVFKPRSRLRELKKDLVAGPEKRF